jgi:hypothetical protein
MKYEKTHGSEAGKSPIPGEEAPHGANHCFRTGSAKMTALFGSPHGFGHSGGQKQGPLRMSGAKGAHRIGMKRGK